VIGTDCIGSCKSNYHTIKATTALVHTNYRQEGRFLLLANIELFEFEACF
jgi:hypothetical protein